MGAFAWVTLATNDSYSLGALVLAHSLKQAGTAHQLAVLVTPGVTSAMREKLASVFNLVQEVNILDSRDEANLRLLKRPELGITFTKLHCWRLTQFDKCVFLDADTLVLQNSDELFEREELSAAPDVGWPDCFNSGVFVYRPSLDTYEKLIQFALEKGSFDGGDQGLLNLYFCDWAHKDISKHLPFIYNLCSTACYSYLPAFKQFGANAKIIHFIGTQKPWLQYFNTETKKVQPSGESSHLQEVLQLWWDIFCSLIHPHLSPAMQGQSQHGMSPSYFPSKFHPPTNPTASADDYESAWDPWDEYDQKIAQNTNCTLISTHYNLNQPIESLNTNTSRVANQPSIHGQSQSHNYSTYTVRNNSYYQPSTPNAVYHHLPRVPTPPPSPRIVYHPPPPIQHPEQCSQHHQEHFQQAPARPPQNVFAEPQPSRHEPPSHSDKHYYHNQQQQQQQSDLNQYSHTSQEHYSEPHDHNHHHQESEQHLKSYHYEHQPHTHYTETQYHAEHEHQEHHHQQHFSYHPDEVHEQFNSQSFSPSPVRSRSPTYPDQSSLLPKECEATTTVSNDRLLSNTIEENSSQEEAGLAGAFSQLTLGVARTAEQDALENVLRKQAWEVGNIDYLGKDSFANIWSKITETLSAAPSQPEASVPEEAAVPTPTAEPEVAPAASQSQTALQDVATSVLPSIPPTDESPKIGAPESSPIHEPLISPSETEPVLSQPSLEAVPADVTTGPTLVSAAVPVEEIKQPDPPVTIEKGTESKAVPETAEETLVVAEADKTPLPKDEIISSEPIEPISAVQEPVLAPPPAAEPIVASSLVESPEIKDVPALATISTENDAAIAPTPLIPEPTAAILSTEAPGPIEASKSDLTATPEAAVPATEAPVITESSAVSKAELTATPATEAVATTEPQAALTASVPEALAPAELVATPAVAVAESVEPAVAPAAAAPVPEQPTDTSLKGSPETKVVEATPPATPGTPPASPGAPPATPSVEKTKQALTAEASAPDTPPPSEGGSTPTPPPRKTDKPKKVAAKPKK